MNTLYGLINTEVSRSTQIQHRGNGMRKQLQRTVRP